MVGDASGVQLAGDGGLLFPSDKAFEYPSHDRDFIRGASAQQDPVSLQGLLLAAFEKPA
jgi:hypothetical protein